MNSEQLEIEIAEQTLQSAVLAGDVLTLHQLIDDDLLFTGPDGSVLSKEDDLGFHRSGEQRITALDFQNQHIRAMGAMVSVSVLAHVAGVFRVMPLKGDFAICAFGTARPASGGLLPVAYLL